MESPCPEAFDGNIWIFGQDFEASSQLSGVQDLSAMRLVLGTLLGGREKAAYESLRRNTPTVYKNLRVSAGAVTLGEQKEGDTSGFLDMYRIACVSRKQTLMIAILPDISSIRVMRWKSRNP
uniref:Uncharacterized protein n=1 Tax=Trichobilharzia regenti TaxID=157069 RepID=A0AA85JN80_TRIRE|nr:unnamed protein product [Trichobilharzia regenti]